MRRRGGCEDRIAFVAGVEGGSHSAVPNAKAAGVTIEAMRHCGPPEHHYAGMARRYARSFWIEEATRPRPKGEWFH